jgi:hypothetical protein
MAVNNNKITEKETTREVEHKPDWHPELSPMLGEIKDAYGYVTEAGTIRLLGPLHEDPDISKFKVESEIIGPLIMLSANGLI